MIAGSAFLPHSFTSRASATLHGHPLADKPPPPPPTPRITSATPCFRELFCGLDAPLTLAIADRKLPIADPEDIKRCGLDLTINNVAAKLISQIANGKHFYTHLGTPCEPWRSLYRKPPSPNIRTLTNLWGESIRDNEIRGIRAAKLTISVVAAALRSNTFVSIENPADSWFFKPPQLEDRIFTGKLFFVRFDTCQCFPAGMRYKKPTRLLTNFPSLLQLSRGCDCEVHDVQLMDNVRTRTESCIQAHLAAEYPPMLCAEWARLVAQAISH